MTRPRRLVREQRGQGLVEFALVLPVLLLILVGIIEFGLIYYHVNSVRQGIREAGRQGSVGNFGSDSSCTNIGPFDTVPSDNMKALMCLTKSELGVPDSTKLNIRFVSSIDLSSPASWAVGNGLVICAIYPLGSVTKLFSPFLDGKFATTRSVFRIETSAVSGNDYTAGAETPPAGASWGSWCTS